MGEAKNKQAEQLRVPQPKKKLGLSVPPALRLPHDDLIPASPSTKPISPEQPVNISAPAKQTRESTNPFQAETARTLSAPTSQTAPLSDTPQPLSQVGAGYQTPPVSQTAPVSQTPAGFTKLSHEVTDGILPTLDTYSQSVFIRLLRLSWGFQKDECRVGLPTLASSCNISMSQARRAIRLLIQRDLIKQVGQDFSNPIQCERGTTYQIIASSAPIYQKAPVRGAAPVRQTAGVRQVPNKETHIKENTQTQEGVGVNSKFSLQECKSYADHLHISKQGITNPGGYATKIHRTGEADALIGAYLEAARTSEPKLDTSGCPDCQGTGYWYPQGTDKGVARCRHEKIRLNT